MFQVVRGFRENKAITPSAKPRKENELRARQSLKHTTSRARSLANTITNSHVDQKNKIDLFLRSLNCSEIRSHLPSVDRKYSTFFMCFSTHQGSALALLAFGLAADRPEQDVKLFAWVRANVVCLFTMLRWHA